ncbi:hypothetical protein [Nitrobacter winogradskyi]|uniref:Uncharacterized protein n=2 Tax=Nitrobacter winogradskyi TaxID=913 RepID=A0ACC6AF61_NITWI|nr:hypothetical protein [Nitrobacter winogradskyi]MCP1998142.1 hypothetical protein [Nitrobacter winogradskyi]GEC15265.1 hypothetical protein NWI01_11570 [Nitrobacter winogradskyi]
MKPLFTMRRAVEDANLLGSMLAGDSWRVWRTLLIASRGEPLSSDELAMFMARTGRDSAPTVPFEELCFVAGRRSGKTVSMSCLATYLAALCDWSDVLGLGDRGKLLFLAQSQSTAKIALDYTSALFTNVPMLAKLVKNITADSIVLKNRIDLEIRPASFRNLRGMSAVGVVADEVAFWRDADSSVNPDREILNAVRPAMARTRGPLIMASSPYARKGVLFETFQGSYGQNDARTLVVHGDTRSFNETVSQEFIDAELARDYEYAAAEYLGQFRTDIADFVSRETVAACIESGVRERLPIREHRYLGFVDPSGGSSDSMTLAIAHKEGKTAILDAVREVKPPFSPEAVVLEFAALLRAYRVSQVTGDKYAGEWCAEQFRKAGIYYEAAAAPKSDLYRDLLPMLNSRGCDLLDNDRLVHQLCGLERRTGRSGKDSIDHGRGAHDDLANSVAGALTLAEQGLASDPKREAAWMKAADRARERMSRWMV